MSKKIPVILDVDTGIDDGVSVMMALKSKKLDVKLITTCHGNTSIENINRNTLTIIGTLNEKVPVAEGMSHALEKDRPHVTVHGADGLGGYVLNNNPLKLVNKSALEAAHKLIQSSEEPITYICVAPPTNLANLLKHYPEDYKKIKEAVLMIGSNEELKEGEIPYKEFNASVDPEALELVLKNPVKKVVVSMEMGHTAYLNWQDVYKTKITNTFGSILEKIYRSYRDGHVHNGIAMHDGCAVAYVIDPKIFELKEANFEVQYFDKLNSGVGVVNYSKPANVKITTSVNIKKVKKLYFSCLKRCKKINIG